MLGVVLLLGIAVVGVTAVLVFGASAIGDTRDTSRTMGVEHTMAQLDAKVAMVALGDSDAQSVEFFDSGDGRYEVRPGAGWINVTHHNHSGSGGVETIVNASLGAVVYDTSDQEVAYQAGGVWRHRGNESGMVSPPEFHYRGATLTFPVIAVKGNASVAGSASVSVEALGSSRRVYPNASASYDAASKSYLNPIERGNVTIELHSRYYEAWAAYFRERTGGAVSVFHENETVRVILVSSRVLGDFDMPAEGNAIEIRGLGDGHPIDDFTITLRPDPHFNNMHWSLYAESGGRKIELHVHSPGKCNGGSYNDELDVSLFYNNGSGGYHEWQNESIPVDDDAGDAFEVNCADGTLTMNLAGDTPLTLDDISLTGGSNKWYFGSEIDSNAVSDVVVFDQHTVDDAGVRNGVYNASVGESETIGFLVNHYLSLLGPSLDLVVSDGPGGSSRVDEGASSGTIDYDTAGGRGFLTFLHVSENRVEVEID